MKFPSSVTISFILAARTEAGFEWPGCVSHSTIIKNMGEALFTDVGAYGGVTGCYIGDCKWSDKFSSISPEECARVCSIAEGCSFWTFGEEDDETKCWLRTGDSGRELNDVFLAGQKSCSPPVWPDCAERHSLIRNANRGLFIDASVFGAASGCFMSDCHNTDKFAVTNMDACARVCSEVPECFWWSFGVEDGENKCWLRQGDDGREMVEGYTSGSRGCIPQDLTPMDFVNANDFEKVAGSWQVQYSNGHLTIYDIGPDGFVTRRNTGRSSQLAVAGSPGDVKSDPNFINGFYLEGMHRDSMWEYIWEDDGVLHLRHFCEDGNCKLESPEGSSLYCCAAVGQRLASPGHEEL